MSRWIASAVLLAGCGREVPKPPAPTPAAPSSGNVAYVEIDEDNQDTIVGNYQIESQRKPGVTRSGDILKVTPAAAAEDFLKVEGPVEKVAIIVAVRHLYSGKGRKGGSKEFFLGGATVTVKAPSRPTGNVGGGILTSFELALSYVRAWPGDVVIRREGDGVLVAMNGKETRLEIGKEVELGRESWRNRVLQEVIDQGQKAGQVVAKGIRRIDQGEAEFQTRLSARFVGVRKLEVEK